VQSGQMEGLQAPIAKSPEFFLFCSYKEIQDAARIFSIRSIIFISKQRDGQFCGL
jgi:hypothetical protein